MRFRRINYLFLFLALSLVSYSQENIPIPRIDLGISTVETPEDLVTGLQILIILTILTLAPAIIIMTTAFIRIIIVLHFIRQALGLQQMPPNQVLVGLTLFLTFFIMEPTIDRMIENGINPYLNQEITQAEMFSQIEIPMKEFMIKQTKVKDLELFLNISRSELPETRDETPIFVIIPAFILSELSRGFEIGILIFIPFIIIDMIVATVLMSLGMMMLPPVMISMPFKLLLFVMVDGWGLLIEMLLKSF